MKTNEFKSLLISALLGSIALTSCDSQDYDVQIPEAVFGKLNIVQKDLTLESEDGSSLSFGYQVTGAKEQIKFATEIENDRFYSTLSYKNGNADWVEVNVFDTDFQEILGKKDMNIVVEKHAKALKKNFNLPTVSRIADILEGIPELLYNELGRDEYVNEATLSLFYHLAAFNTARRSYESRTNDCQCDVNPNYLNGGSPFFCAEDIMVSVDWYYDFIKEKAEMNKFAGQKFNPKSLYKYLSNESGKYVSASKIDKILSDELEYFLNKLNIQERQQIMSENLTLSTIPEISTNSEWWEFLPYDTKCILMGVIWGSDCGCCMNYSGLCHYCDTFCLVHDISCQKCEPPGWCLPACKPGPCY